MRPALSRLLLPKPRVSAQATRVYYAGSLDRSGSYFEYHVVDERSVGCFAWDLNGRGDQHPS
jgi:hypothetical protein